MREIKFRAWDDIERKFWTLENSGEESGAGSVQFFGNEKGELEFGRLEVFDTGLGMNSEFTAFPLIQYTGLKDKNGVEVYEGDIIEGLFDYGPGGLIQKRSKVYFNLIHGYQWEYWSAPDIEVIGNIYENPELLEVPNE